jgi:hypothetical protein
MGRGKTKQLAMTAVARELAGFVWAVGVEVERQLALRPVRGVEEHMLEQSRQRPGG